MYTVAVEKKLNKKLNTQTIQEVFGRPIHRGKIILIAQEPEEVIPYPEDIESYNNRDLSSSISLSDFKKSLG